MTTTENAETQIMNDQEKLRREKAALNSVLRKGAGSMSTVVERFKSALEIELDAAYNEAGLDAPSSPTYTREWKNEVGSQTIVWERKATLTGEFYEGLQVEVQRFAFDKVQESRFSTWAEVKFKGQPDNIALAFTAKVKDGRRVLHAQKDVVTDVTSGNIPILRVFIDWDRGIPHCRSKHKDNINIIFVDPDGAHVVMLEVSITSRNGRFWVAIQELFAGQIARTTAAKAAGIGLTTLPLDGFAGLAIPVYPENNYPGADFLKNFADAGPGIIRYVAEKGFIVPLCKCSKPPEWSPKPAPELPEAMTKNGWQVAAVLWFNLVIGFGFARLADGRSVFVHFKSLVDADGRQIASKGFPLLEPMQNVALRFQKGEKGGLQATAIRLLS